MDTAGAGGGDECRSSIGGNSGDSEGDSGGSLESLIVGSIPWNKELVLNCSSAKFWSVFGGGRLSISLTYK